MHRPQQIFDGILPAADPGGVAMTRAIRNANERSPLRDDFKVAMRQVAHSVAIVTARSKNFHDGVTATAVCSATADPPTMLACVPHDSATGHAIREAGAFAVNFLSEEQHHIARQFSKGDLNGPDNFMDDAWTVLETGSPILKGAVAVFDCTLDQHVISGTRGVFIGWVVAVTSLDDDALIYRDGAFRRLAPSS